MLLCLQCEHPEIIIKDTYESLNLALLCYKVRNEGKVTMECYGISVKKTSPTARRFLYSKSRRL